MLAMKVDVEEELVASVKKISYTIGADPLAFPEACHEKSTASVLELNEARDPVPLGALGDSRKNGSDDVGDDVAIESEEDASPSETVDELVTVACDEVAASPSEASAEVEL